MRSLVPIGLGCPGSVALPQIVSRRHPDFSPSVASRKHAEMISAVYFRSVSGACPDPVGELSENSVLGILLNARPAACFASLRIRFPRGRSAEPHLCSEPTCHPGLLHPSGEDPRCGQIHAAGQGFARAVILPRRAPPAKCVRRASSELPRRFALPPTRPCDIKTLHYCCWSSSLILR